MKRESPMTSLFASTRRSAVGHVASAIIAFSVLITGAVAADPTPPAIDDISSYTRCAGEYQSFVLPGSCDVAYGTNGLYVFKTGQSGTVVFSNGTFGDPIPGVAKSGYFRTTVLYPPSDPTGTGTGLTGDYYDNIFVKGFFKRRIDPMINFPWGGADPMSGIAAGAYSVRWTGKIQTRYDDTYTLITTSDDGVRVWVDGQPIINDWTTHGNKENAGTFVSQAGQKHDIRIEYFEGGGGAFMRLEWQSAHQARALVPTSCLFSQGAETPTVLPTYVPGTGTGLTGDYRNISDLSGSHIRRLDPIINFRWGDGSPDSNIATDNFTVRWTGQIQTRFDGDCTLSTISDDGVLLYLDGKLLINDWTTHGDKENTCTFTSKAGQKHDIRIEYFESGGGADMYLKWQSANEGYALVPTSCLYPYDMATAIPSSSIVSPAYIEGFYGSTVPAISAGVLSDLGESRFYGNIPLCATSVTSVSLTEDGIVKTGSIEWETTLIEDNKNLIVSVGDSLLFQAIQGGSLKIFEGYTSFGCTVVIAPPKPEPVTFSKPGLFVLKLYNQASDEVASMNITVVGTDLAMQPIADHLGFAREVTVTVTPKNAPISFESSNLSLVAIGTPVFTNNQATILVTSLRPGCAEIWADVMIGSRKKTISRRQVESFTLTTSAKKYIAVISTNPDGSKLALAQLTMTPLIPDIGIHMTTFSSGLTFDDSTTLRDLSTNIFLPDGTYLYRLLRASDGNIHYCHTFRAMQNNKWISP
jgi:PA14 domain